MGFFRFIRHGRFKRVGRQRGGFTRLHGRYGAGGIRFGQPALGEKAQKPDRGVFNAVLFYKGGLIRLNTGAFFSAAGFCDSAQ